jgi:hypothetical protein
MRRGARTDANQCVIVETFRRCGWSVCDLSGVGDGVKDLLIGRPGINVLVEIKDGEKSASRRKLTPMQIIFHAEWIGPQDICTSIEEANRISTFWGERATAYHRMNTRDRRHEQPVQTKAKGEDYE